ncbi:MAG: hypothetical protein ACK5HO_03240, partial [Pseudomonadota bacterium]
SSGAGLLLVACLSATKLNISGGYSEAESNSVPVQLTSATHQCNLRFTEVSGYDLDELPRARRGQSEAHRVVFKEICDVFTDRQR